MLEQETSFFSSDIPIPPPPRAIDFRKVGKWCLLAMVFLVPFFFLPVTDNPLNINKLCAVGFLIIAAFICLLRCVLVERKLEYPRSLFAVIFLLFLGVQGLSTWFSLAPGKSLFGNLATPDSLISFIMYLFVFYLFFFFFQREDIPKIGIAVGIGLAIATVIALFDASNIFLLPWHFLRTPDFNPVGTQWDWGIMLIALIAALAILRPGNVSRRYSIIFFSAVGLALISLIVLNYQSLWLMLAFFTIAAAIFRFEPKEHFRYAFGIIVFALFFALIGSRLPVFANISPDFRPSPFTTLQVAQGVFKQHGLLLGSGPSTFALDFEAFRPTSTDPTNYGSFTFLQGHDFITTLLATGGLLSFLLFLCVVVLIIRPLFRLQSFDSDLAMVVTAVAALTIALFVYPASFAQFIILFAFLGILNIETSRHTVSFDSLTRGGSFALSFGVTALAVALLAGLFVMGEQYIAAVLIGQADALVASGDLDQAFLKTNQALKLDPNDRYFRDASNILLSEAKILASSGGLGSLQFSTIIAGTVQSAESAAAENSHDPANWGNLGSTYEALLGIINGTDLLAIKSYQKAANLNPSNPQWDVDMARVSLESAVLLPASSSTDSSRQEKWKNAENFLQHAIALNDKYADARVLLVQLYLQEGNITQAIEKLHELKQQNPLDPGVAFQLGYLYYENQQIDQAQEEFQVATILDPSYSNARYFLGLIYDLKGMKSQAISQFQQIQSLNPDNGQVKDILINLEAGQPALANNVGPSALSGESNALPLSTGSSTIMIKKSAK